MNDNEVESSTATEDTRLSKRHLLSVIVVCVTVLWLAELAFERFGTTFIVNSLQRFSDWFTKMYPMSLGITMIVICTIVIVLTLTLTKKR